MSEKRSFFSERKRRNVCEALAQAGWQLLRLTRAKVPLESISIMKGGPANE
jgi:hypothetical protein